MMGEPDFGQRISNATVRLVSARTRENVTFARVETSTDTDEIQAGGITIVMKGTVLQAYIHMTTTSGRPDWLMLRIVVDGTLTFCARLGDLFNDGNYPSDSGLIRLHQYDDTPDNGIMRFMILFPLTCKSSIRISVEGFVGLGKVMAVNTTILYSAETQATPAFSAHTTPLNSSDFCGTGGDISTQ